MKNFEKIMQKIVQKIVPKLYKNCENFVEKKGKK